MDAKFTELSGESVSAEAIVVPKARELLAFLATDIYRFARLISPYRSKAGHEGAIVDLVIEVGQEPVHDIRQVERVALLFLPTDEFYPQILALRADFPEVPHLNPREDAGPPSICIYEESYSVARLNWTPSGFLERIRLWFGDNALGALHRDDQPLEPILMPGPRRLVIPADLFSAGSNDAPEKLWIIPRYSSPSSELFVARRADRHAPPQGPHAMAYLATTFQTPVQTHGVIRRLPKNLLDLHNLMLTAGVDFFAMLRERMLSWTREDAPLGASLIIIVFFPKARSEGKPPEVSDIWAFLTVGSIQQVGARLGIWQALPAGQVAALVGSDINRQNAAGIEVFVMNPSFALSRFHAALSNGFAPSALQITAVGVGALGSQTVPKLIRGGFGLWCLIDDDCLLPHNVARHELPESAVGLPKALAMQHLGNSILEDQAASGAIVADVLNPREKREEVATALAKAELILDFSASIPVARHLAANEATARRVSAFMNADATDLVVLAEGVDRGIPLDCIEMQYYRELLIRPELAGHLVPKSDQRIRYAHTCRDLTSVIPEDLVGLHSAIAARAIRQTVDEPDAAIRIWRTGPDLGVNAMRFNPFRVHEIIRGDWTIRADEYLLTRLFALRQERLPNETGGVFIGAFDLERRIAYCVDTIASPPDSKEWPMLYIRGHKGLRQRLQEIDGTTAGMLRYIGEWHSHPEGCGTRPSGDDKKVFQWLSDFVRVDGVPPIMAIVGEGDDINWFLGTIP